MDWQEPRPLEDGIELGKMVEMKMDWSALGQELLNWSWMDGVKLFLSALVIVLATKVQVVNDKLSALLVALPLTSLLAMMWMNAEKQGNDRIANHAESTFWLVLPSLPMFLVLPWMLRKGWDFGWVLAANCVLTIFLFLGMALLLRKLGLKVF